MLPEKSLNEICAMDTGDLIYSHEPFDCICPEFYEDFYWYHNFELETKQKDTADEFYGELFTMGCVLKIEDCDLTHIEGDQVLIRGDDGICNSYELHAL